MRVLWITPQFPDPRGAGGAVHEYELLRAVAPSHDITLVTTDWARAEPLKAVRALGVDVEVVPWRPRHAKGSRAGDFVRLALGAAPTLATWNRVPRMKPLAETVRALERRERFDVAQILLGDMAPAATAIRAPVALLLFDVYSRQTDLLLRGSDFPHHLRWRMQRRNAIAFERRWYPRADGIACVSQIDAGAVEALVHRHVDTVPNPIPDDFFDPPTVSRSDTIVTVVGSFAWGPNVDTAEWMCDEIWPLVREVRPHAKLRVVGRYGSDALRARVQAAGGELHADVDDIRPYYWEAAVIAAPVRMGSGTRNKVLHAMACGAPVVATATALEGIPAEAGRDLLVAEGARAFAGAVVQALDQRSEALSRAETARDVAARFTSAAAGQALVAWWAATAAKRPAHPAPARTRREESRMPAASVVIVTRERAELLRRSVAAVARAAGAVPGTEILLVEQGTPSAAEVCSSLAVTASVVRDDGVGASRARNIGARAARGDIVLFTDDDCEVPERWVRDHEGALADRDVVASFGRVAGLGSYDEEHDPAAMPARHRRGRPPWLVGHASNMAVRREAFLAAGGFDERIGPGTGTVTAGEDADLIVRLLRTGREIATGTGEPVRHIEWRSGEQLHDNLVAYERGAGMWIGKAFRESPTEGFAFLRGRLALIRDLAAYARENGGPAVPVAALSAALARGLAAGVRMRPWRG